MPADHRKLARAAAQHRQGPENGSRLAPHGRHAWRRAGCPGTIVTFTHGNREARLAEGAPVGCTQSMRTPAPDATERQGKDRLQFTRNYHCAGPNNGDVATVIPADSQSSSLLVETKGCEGQMLNLRRVADSHVRHGWVRTIYSAQSATCDGVLAHLESSRADTVDATLAYVAIRRPPDRQSHIH